MGRDVSNGEEREGEGFCCQQVAGFAGGVKLLGCPQLEKVFLSQFQSSGHWVPVLGFGYWCPSTIFPTRELGNLSLHRVPVHGFWVPVPKLLPLQIEARFALFSIGYRYSTSSTSTQGLRKISLIFSPNRELAAWVFHLVPVLNNVFRY